MAFRYQTLAAELAQRIREQYYLPATALPSLRHFAEHHAISLSTATKVYAVLEQQGFIAAKAKQGFFVKAIFVDAENASKALKKTKLPKAKIVKKDTSDNILEVLHNALRSDVIPWGGGWLPAHLLPIAALQRSLNRATRRHPQAASSYGDKQGLPSLRAVISERMAARHCAIPASHLLITNGCLEAVVLAVNVLTRPHDVVAIFTPCYSGLLMALVQSHRTILEIPCGVDGPDLAYLEELMRAKAMRALVFSATAYNPIGFNLSAEKKQRFSQLLARYKIPAIEDDAFGELSFDAKNTSPVFAYQTLKHAQSMAPIIYTSSFSKALTTGYRVGWLACAGDITPYVKHKLNMNLTVSQPVQSALADFLNTERYGAHIQRIRLVLEQQLLMMMRLFLALFPAGTECHLPQGGLFLWLHLPDKISSMDFYKRALEQGIMVCPGEIFSMAGGYKNYLRITASFLPRDEILRVIHILAGIAEDLNMRGLVKAY